MPSESHDREPKRPFAVPPRVPDDVSAAGRKMVDVRLSSVAEALYGVIEEPVAAVGCGPAVGAVVGAARPQVDRKFVEFPQHPRHVHRPVENRTQEVQARVRDAPRPLELLRRKRMDAEVQVVAVGTDGVDHPACSDLIEFDVAKLDLPALAHHSRDQAAGGAQPSGLGCAKCLRAGHRLLRTEAVEQAFGVLDPMAPQPVVGQIRRAGPERSGSDACVVWHLTGRARSSQSRRPALATTEVPVLPDWTIILPPRFSRPARSARRGDC
jgi:hypothetical protein